MSIHQIIYNATLSSTYKPSVLFLGTPQFALPSLRALHEAGYPLLGVVTQPDKPSGRGQKMTSPPCALYAREHRISLHQPEQIRANEKFLSEIEKLLPDLIVVVAYGHFLSSRLLSLPKKGAINVHASLLPKYRGAAPINWAIMKGEEETGVSIMRITEKMDAGPVYSQKTFPLSLSETAGSLTEKLSYVGAQLLLETLPGIISGELRAQSQDETKATMAPRLKKEDGKIDFNQPALVIFNRIRGLNPWPGAYTSIDPSTSLGINAKLAQGINPELSRRVDNKILKIYHASVLPEKLSQKPGTVIFLSEEGISVSCKNSIICLTDVQLEGKKRMSAAEFVRGYRLKIGQKFL